MPHQDTNLILSRCLYEAVGLGNALGNGLLDKKMKTLLGTGNADGRMEMVGQSKNDTWRDSLSTISS